MRNEPWQRLLEHSPDPTIVVDGDGRILYASRRCLEVLGYAPAELEHQPLDLLIPEQSRAVHGEHFARYARNPLSRPMGRGMHLSARRKDGTEVPVEVALSQVELVSGPVVIATIRDITERLSHEVARRTAQRELEAAQAALNALVLSVPDVVISMDHHGIIQFVNRPISVSHEPLVDRPWLDFVPSDQQAEMSAALGAVLEGTNTRTELQLCYQDEGGRGGACRIACRIAPIIEAGEITGAVLVARDVTAQAALEAQLATAERMASMGLLAAGVAHELNNPLAVVVANLSFALREHLRAGATPALSSELADVLRDANEAAARVKTIVQDLRVFSRAEETMGQVDLRRVLQSTLRMARNELRHRAKLEETYSELSEVWGNESRLGQVFLNLVVNAAQSIPAGHAEANEVSVSTRAGPPGFAVVEISDTGCGMSPRDQQHLFEPFFTTKPPGVGTGLGLAICARVVHDLGGKIEVESQVGRGSVFRVYLRLAADRPIAATAPAQAPREVPATRRGRVLIIDDEPTIVAAITRSLQREHEVESTGNIHEALKLIAAGAQFDVILCDVMMPEGTGPEFHASLERTDPALADRVIFLTGGAFTEQAASFLSHVRNPVLEKPFDPSHLQALVNERVG